MHTKKGILLIETATRVCSAAYAVSGDVLCERICTESNSNHATMLAPFVKEVLDEASSQGYRPEAVAVSAGPGSYTGLRIGASTAKGLAFGYDLPLIAVPTLQIVAAAVAPLNPDRLRTRILLDARRMEVYTAMYDATLRPITQEEAVIVNASSFAEDLASGPLIFAGDGVSKCRDLLSHPQATFIDGIYPTAMAMATPAQQLLEQEVFVDVAYWEPDYLKEYVAVVGKNKVLNNLNKTI